jgi:hypothetical protein
VRAVLPVLPLLPLDDVVVPGRIQRGERTGRTLPGCMTESVINGLFLSDTRRSLSKSRTGSLNMLRCPVRGRRGIGNRHLVHEVAAADLAHLATTIARSQPPIPLAQRRPTIRKPDQRVQPAQLGVFLSGQAPRHVACIGSRRDGS